MDSLVNSLKSSALGIAEYFTPVLKESKFSTSGVVTPEEFVLAGDHLVHLCPTWQWVGSNESRAKPYLPLQKQYLLTRNVPCYQRCQDIQYSISQEKVIQSGEADDGWIDTHHYAIDPCCNTDTVLVGPSPVASYTPIESRRADKEQPVPDDDMDEGPTMDMDQFFDDGLLDANEKDENCASAKSNQPKVEEENICKTRTYDLIITYDKFYQVPRMWLSGYREDRTPLSVDEMYEDFSQDHVKKTITMEQNPHVVGPPMASIHPCRHAETMKRLIETFAENGKELGVHQYLVVFLKFVQAVIPTVEYDYSKNVTF